MTGKMSTFIRVTARMLPTTSPAMATMTVMGCRNAKMIGLRFIWVSIVCLTAVWRALGTLADRSSGYIVIRGEGLEAKIVKECLACALSGLLTAQSCCQHVSHYQMFVSSFLL